MLITGDVACQGIQSHVLTTQIHFLFYNTYIPVL